MVETREKNRRRRVRKKELHYKLTLASKEIPFVLQVSVHVIGILTPVFAICFRVQALIKCKWLTQDPAIGQSVWEERYNSYVSMRRY